MGCQSAHLNQRGPRILPILWPSRILVFHQPWTWGLSSCPFPTVTTGCSWNCEASEAVWGKISWTRVMEFSPQNNFNIFILKFRPFPTSTQLGDTSIVKYIYNGKSTRRDCTCVVKRNYRRCKEFTLKNWQQSEEPCWFSNVNSIIIIITYKKSWWWTWYPGPYSSAQQMFQENYETQEIVFVGLVLPAQIWGICLEFV